MNPITITPVDLTGKLIFRMALADGSFDGTPFDISVANNGDIIVEANGRQVSIEIRSIIDQLLPQLTKAADHEGQEGS